MDPTAVSESRKERPMDYALQLLVDADNPNDEMLCLLAEFTEMPEHIKLVYLSKLMYKGECWGYSQDKAKAREDFRKILSSLPVELVSLALLFGCDGISSTQICYSLALLLQIKCNAILLWMTRNEIFFHVECIFFVASFSVASFSGKS